MDQRERIDDEAEIYRVAFESGQSGLWTSLPAIVQSFKAAQGTCTAQPTVKARVRGKAGDYAWVALPLLVDVPIVFPGAGGFLVTFPVKQGDECLIVFASRCIDGWWQQGGIQTQAELRMHDLSDGFAIPGPRSLPRAISNISTTTAQLRSEDGTCYVELAPGGVVNIKAPGGVNIIGALSTNSTVAAGGNVSVTGTVTATAEGTFNGGHTVSAHRHAGVTVGAGTTNTPTG